MTGLPVVLIVDDEAMSLETLERILEDDVDVFTALKGVEARGSLGRWQKVKNGRILNYQFIAPTTWNFSPRDALGNPGLLERALVGAPVRKGEKEPVSMQHIVRSFDPCMVCAVH